MYLISASSAGERYFWGEMDDSSIPYTLMCRELILVSIGSVFEPQIRQGQTVFLCGMFCKSEPISGNFMEEKFCYGYHDWL